MIKKNIILLAGLIIPFICCAQIGINTDNPKGVFHFDGALNASTRNPATGNVSAAQAADDVIITEDGNMGVGTLNPTTKVHIAPSKIPLLRISDGSEADGKILGSGNQGEGSWIPAPTSGGIIYNILGGATYPQGQSSLVKAMPITETGNYMVFIRWWGISNLAYGSLNDEASAYFFLDESPNATAARGTQHDAIEYYVRTLTNTYFTLTTAMYAKATAGNYLKIFVAPSVGGSWQIGVPQPNEPTLNPSIIIFKI